MSALDRNPISDGAITDRLAQNATRPVHPGFPCAKCVRGDHGMCTGFDGSLTEHPDSQPLCICRDCFPKRYQNLIDYGWSNP